MDGAVVVRANGERGAYAFAAQNDGGLGGFARWYRLGIWVVMAQLNLTIGAAADGSRPLFFRGAVPVLNLDEFGMSGNFAVDVSVDLRVKARGVALHVGKESRIEFAAAGARDASSCGWVEGRVG